MPKQFLLNLILLLMSSCKNPQPKNSDNKKGSLNSGITASDKFAGSCVQETNALNVCLESYNISDSQAQASCEATDPRKLNIPGVSGQSTYSKSPCSTTAVTAKCLFENSSTSFKNVQFNYGRTECPPGSKNLLSSSYPNTTLPHAGYDDDEDILNLNGQIASNFRKSWEGKTLKLTSKINNNEIFCIDFTMSPKGCLFRFNDNFKNATCDIEANDNFISITCEKDSSPDCMAIQAFALLKSETHRVIYALNTSGITLTGTETQVNAWEGLLQVLPKGSCH